MDSCGPNSGSSLHYTNKAADVRSEAAGIINEVKAATPGLRPQKRRSEGAVCAVTALSMPSAFPEVWGKLCSHIINRAELERGQGHLTIKHRLVWLVNTQ